MFYRRREKKKTTSTKALKGRIAIVEDKFVGGVDDEKVDDK